MKAYVAIVVASALDESPVDSIIRLCNGLVNFALAVWGLLVLGAS